MSSSQTIKWGIIGCGDVTEVKSGPAYNLTEGFELTAVMRRDEAKLKDYAKRHQIEKYYTNADDLINDPDIDAVYIATPPDSHKHYALKVAAANKICCIEKPLAPSYQDSFEILSAFNQRETPLFVAYYRRSLPRFEKVYHWIKKGEIGTPRHISWQLMKPPSKIDLAKEKNWRTEVDVAPGGYFDDLASHGLDLFNYLLGDISQVSGFSLNQQQLYSAKDAISSSWLHNSGATGMGSWNFGCDSNLDRVEIFGSEGKIEFSVFEENPIKLIKGGNVVEELTIEHPKHVQVYHVENMKKHLFENDYLHPSTGKTAVHTNWVMDQILGQIPA